MTKPTITLEQQQAIANRLASIPHLAVGMGTEDAPCSIAAINLALTGELTDEIPECMSEIIGRWIIATQDAIPSELCRDHPRWRELLPLAAGTGRELEAERLQVVIDWMWDVLASPAIVAAVPDSARGAWATMLEERTVDAAEVAFYAAHVAHSSRHRLNREAPPRRHQRKAPPSAFVAAVAWTAEATTGATYSVAHAAAAAAVVPVAAAADAARAAAVAATRAAAVAAVATPGPDLWPDVDPIGLLERLIKIGLNDD